MDFNSHAHVERDSFVAGAKQIQGISTHTLTWSVTYRQANKHFTFRDFNSHAHVERDLRMCLKQFTVR